LFVTSSVLVTATFVVMFGHLYSHAEQYHILFCGELVVFAALMVAYLEADSVGLRLSCWELIGLIS
jgi:hypothetical protein